MSARDRLTALLMPLCEDLADVLRTNPEEHCAELVDGVLAVVRQDAAILELQRRVALSTAVIDATLDVCRQWRAYSNGCKEKSNELETGGNRSAVSRSKGGDR